MFKIGDKAIFPAHGVGTIKRIETRKIGGHDTDFFVLEVISSGAVLMIPAKQASASGMRRLGSASDVLKVYDILRMPSKIQHSTWNRRFREFNDKLRTGDLMDSAEVLRDLATLKADKDLSYGEKKMMDKALSLLVSEISLVTDARVADVESHLNGLLNKAQVNRESDDK